MQSTEIFWRYKHLANKNTQLASYIKHIEILYNIIIHIYRIFKVNRNPSDESNWNKWNFEGSITDTYRRPPFQHIKAFNCCGIYLLNIIFYLVLVTAYGNIKLLVLYQCQYYAWLWISGTLVSVFILLTLKIIVK